MLVRATAYLFASLVSGTLLAQPIEAAPHPKRPPQTRAKNVSAESSRDPAVQAIEQWLRHATEARLDNGLRVVLAPDSESPTVSVCVTYDVGSRNEGLGQSGFAHLFEHMMFQGSRNVAKGEHFQLITAHGGQLNGTTSADRTNYFETLPPSELELALWLEADRMRWLDVSESNFENQRAVVKEEYRMRVENAAYRPALIELDRLVFAGYAPYEHPTIGSMADLDAAKLEWVREFHRRYYVPNHAVLTISGSFAPAQALELVGKYFGPVPAVETAPFQPPPVPALRAAEQRTAVNDVNAKTAGVLYGWRIPASREKAHYALEMAARVLADGDSSLLYDHLVRKGSLAREVSAFTYDHRGPDAFVITVELNQAAKVEEVEDAIRQHLHRLAEEGPSEELLKRARQRMKSSLVFGLQSNQARAIALGEYATYFGDFRMIAQDLDALLRVTSADIQHAVRSYLAPDARTVVIVRPVSASHDVSTAQIPIKTVSVSNQAAVKPPVPASSNANGSIQAPKERR